MKTSVEIEFAIVRNPRKNINHTVSLGKMLYRSKMEMKNIKCENIHTLAIMRINLKPL